PQPSSPSPGPTSQAGPLPTTPGAANSVTQALSGLGGGARSFVDLARRGFAEPIEFAAPDVSAIGAFGHVGQTGAGGGPVAGPEGLEGATSVPGEFNATGDLGDVAGSLGKVGGLAGLLGLLSGNAPDFQKAFGAGGTALSGLGSLANNPELL